jgi:hypothetical protein
VEVAETEVVKMPLVNESHATVDAVVGLPAVMPLGSD